MMRHTGPRQHTPARLEQAVIEWADASAELAAVLRQINYTPLRLCQPPPPRSCWLSWIYRALNWQRCVTLALVLHPGIVRP
jgi:hypothetical protein